MYSKSRNRTLSWLTGLGLIALLSIGAVGGLFAKPKAAAFQIEPGAGSWHTWVLTSGSQLRPAKPPDRRATQAEIQELKQMANQRNQVILDRIAFWNTGAPAYRWNEFMTQEALAHNLGSPRGSRAYAILNTAISDATVAAWDAKYTYRRLRPRNVNRSLTTVIETPLSPAYPSEHAVTAGAASEILAYLFPERAAHYRQLAIEAGEAFLYAGVQYRSDYVAGLKLGQDVAALAIERAQNDGSGAVWDGTMPTGPGYWTGSNPVLPMGGTWKTFALDSGSEFRPGPPNAYDSPEMAAELNEVKTFTRTPYTNTTALFWEHGAGGARAFVFWNEQTGRKLFEYGLDANPPRAARAYALQSVAFYDGFVACWDAKYTYWAIRPFQLDPTLTTVFTTPNHPSYPSAHSCLSGSSAEVLAYLFPRDAAAIQTMLTEVAESRIWAGIHFRNDVNVGLQLARDVAGKVIGITQGDDTP
jgi:membrane-associated phospholipid phosphatase